MDSPPEQPICVLHVDDDPAFLPLVERFLHRADEAIEVVSVDDPTAALERLQSDDSIECVLSDYEMPAMDGLEFLRRVRACRPNMPFVLYTARGDESVAADAISAGVDDYVTKDVGATHYLKLSVRIRRAVERARAEAERATQLAALEAVREGICIVGRDGRITYANRAYLELYGYERSELLGASWETLHPDEEVSFITTEVLPRVEGDGGWEETGQGVRADETRVDESKSVAALPDGGLVIVVTAYDSVDQSV